MQIIKFTRLLAISLFSISLTSASFAQVQIKPVDFLMDFEGLQKHFSLSDEDIQTLKSSVGQISLVNPNDHSKIFNRGTFFVTKDGKSIMTALHVVKYLVRSPEAVKAILKLASGEEIILDEIMSVDKTNDLAELKIKQKRKQSLKLLEEDSEFSLEPGAAIFSMGYPYDSPKPIASIGHFLNEAKNEKRPNLEFSNIALFPGMSGGPVIAVDANHKLLGVIGLNVSIPSTSTADVFPEGAFMSHQDAFFHFNRLNHSFLSHPDPINQFRMEKRKGKAISDFFDTVTTNWNASPTIQITQINIAAFTREQSPHEKIVELNIEILVRLYSLIESFSSRSRLEEAKEEFKSSIKAITKSLIQVQKANKDLMYPYLYFPILTPSVVEAMLAKVKTKKELLALIRDYENKLRSSLAQSKIQAKHMKKLEAFYYDAESRTQTYWNIFQTKPDIYTPSFMMEYYWRTPGLYHRFARVKK